VCLFDWGALFGEAAVLERWAETVEDLLVMGLGRAKTPQFVKPRITPPLLSIILPAVRAMLHRLVI